MPVSTTRLYGKDIAQATIGTVDVSPLLQSMDIERSIATADVTVLGDHERASRGVLAEGRITLTLALDKTYEGDLNLLASYEGDDVEVHFKLFSGAATGAGTRMFNLASATSANTMFCNSVRISIAEGGQTATVELMPNGTGAFYALT